MTRRTWTPELLRLDPEPPLVSRRVTSGPSTAVLVIAVLGLVLSTSSLVWQAATFRLNGPRVRAELLVGAMSAHGFATAPVGKNWRRDLAALQRNELPNPVVAVRVRNIGRQATTVTGYRAVFDTGGPYGLTGAPPGCPQLPYRLEADDVGMWWLPLDEVARVVLLTGEADVVMTRVQTVQMAVDLGSGRQVTTRSRLHADELRSWIAA